MRQRGRTCGLRVLFAALAVAGCWRTALDSVAPENRVATPEAGVTPGRADATTKPPPPDAATPRDAPAVIDVLPSAERPVAGCSIAGAYITNGGNIKELLLAPNGTYLADGSRFAGKYTWDGAVIQFVPSFGSTSSECPSRAGSSYSLLFDPACARILVKTLTDNCTGGGLLTTTSMLTRR